MLFEASSFDMDKVVTTVKQFFRDWSKEVGLEGSHMTLCRGDMMCM